MKINYDLCLSLFKLSMYVSFGIWLKYNYDQKSDFKISKKMKVQAMLLSFGC